MKAHDNFHPDAVACRLFIVIDYYSRQKKLFSSNWGKMKTDLDCYLEKWYYISVNCRLGLESEINLCEILRKISPSFEHEPFIDKFRLFHNQSSDKSPSIYIGTMVNHLRSIEINTSSDVMDSNQNEKQRFPDFVLYKPSFISLIWDDTPEGLLLLRTIYLLHKRGFYSVFERSPGRYISWENYQSIIPIRPSTSKIIPSLMVPNTDCSERTIDSNFYKEVIQNPIPFADQFISHCSTKIENMILSLDLIKKGEPYNM